MAEQKPTKFPKQHQNRQPGREHEMKPRPASIRDSYRGSNKLKDKVAVITGGDSGIGRSVAAHYAREGADVAVVYLNEHRDAEETREMVEREGRQCVLIAGDVGDPSFCRDAVGKTVDQLGRLDIVVNNAAVQIMQKSIEDITPDQLETTFRTNIFSMFYVIQAALRHLKEGSSIINTTSITAFQGNAVLLDYSSTKGAILALTRALSQNLAPRGIRVNCVAPGPIWTPLIPSSFPAEQVVSFGKDTPLGRAGQPEEVGPCYVWLASEEASYITGQTIHVDGGKFVAS